MINEIEFLTAAECLEIQRAVHLLRKKWIPRQGGFIPIFTLGSASYLDADRTNDEEYRKLGLKNNEFLRENFQLLYDRLQTILSQKYKLPVVYEENLAVPGFHIFQSHKLLEQPIAASHFDLQFQKIQWPYSNIDLANPVSFTAAIALPTEGGGLNYWDIFYKDHSKATKNELSELAAKSEKHYYPYKLGQLMVHDGLFLHQIAPGKNLQPNDERVTLQGHGLICDGALHLYW